METIVMVLQHATKDVDQTRIKPMMMELDRVARQYDFKIVASGSKEFAMKILTNGVLPILPGSLKSIHNEA
jgi:hypothetical protein